jgi:hypothetical protein
MLWWQFAWLFVLSDAFLSVGKIQTHPTMGFFMTLLEIQPRTGISE